MSTDLHAEIREIAAQRIVCASTVVRGPTWGPAYGPLLAEVLEYVAGARASPAGPPIARFEIRADDVLLEAGVPVDVELAGEGRVRRALLPGGTAAIATHRGPYTSLGPVHEGLRAWIEAQGRRLAGPFWEVYLTDPRAEPDESRWLTQLVYLLAT